MLPLLLPLLHGSDQPVLRGPASCTARPLPQLCSDGKCHPDNENCPPVTTDSTCGEVPHSGRDGRVLTWGLSFRTDSAQECCDRCKCGYVCRCWAHLCPLFRSPCLSPSQVPPKEVQLVDLLRPTRVLGTRHGPQPHLRRVLAATAEWRCAGDRHLSPAWQVHGAVAQPAPEGAAGLQAQRAVGVFPDARAVDIRRARRPAFRPHRALRHWRRLGQGRCEDRGRAPRLNLKRRGCREEREASAVAVTALPWPMRAQAGIWFWFGGFGFSVGQLEGRMGKSLCRFLVFLDP